MKNLYQEINIKFHQVYFIFKATYPSILSALHLLSWETRQYSGQSITAWVRLTQITMSPLSLTRRTTFNESLKHLSCRLLVHRVIMLEGQEEIGDCTYDVHDTKEMLKKKKKEMLRQLYTFPLGALIAITTWWVSLNSCLYANVIPQVSPGGTRWEYECWGGRVSWVIHTVFPVDSDPSACSAQK